MHTQITTDWNANPNAPQVQLSVDNTSVTLEFYLNSFLFDNFHEEDKAKLTFLNCHKYSFNAMNDEGYHKGQYRYKYTDLPWGEFYKLDTNWASDFPVTHTILIPSPDNERMNHYIFFFKDNTFECVAEGFKIEFLLAHGKRIEPTK